jgi:glycosyltransferase involved in cell wall biosynthesis
VTVGIDPAGAQPGGAPAAGRVVVVVPCHNEAGRLPVDRFTEFVDAEAEYGFVFVDDGSTDRTRELLEELRAARPGRFGLLALGRNHGKAEAVRRGFVASLRGGAAILGFWDADLATPLDALPELVRVLDTRPEVDIALGARVRLLGRDIRRRPLRHYLGRCFATAASLTLRLPVYDTQCGAKVFRVTDTLRAVFAEPFLSAWIFDVEILARYVVARRGRAGVPIEKRLYELPLRQWRDVAGSNLGPSAYWRAVVDLVRILRAYDLGGGE